ncbi:MAG TPA: arsenosugar biosynthesis radical SAM protein ArsS [Candidatus Dorea intestinavium]|nr:arsenosugar biosynthesis radical SAM protein ArsS [Candidatus Dorea intestinavium]
MSDVMDFNEHLIASDYAYTAKNLDVMQMNLGKLCNLSCKHCHVEAGPKRTEIMPWSVMEACLLVFEKYKMKTIDITGGAPEMNPNFEKLLRKAAKISSHVIVRTNLVILKEEKYAHFLDLYKELKIEVVCSLPYYRPDTMNRVRGDGTFETSIEILQKLNQLGYGREEGLVLNLVYNPSGAFFAPPQETMEAEYKYHLKKDFAIDFNHLFTIINNPVGRFGAFLKRSDNYDGYLKKLEESFNPATLEGMMCRFQLSVSYDGSVYDCDFNQAIDLKITSDKTIFDLVCEDYSPRKIQFKNHCYACTAGQGSSCGGATN